MLARRIGLLLRLKYIWVFYARSELDQSSPPVSFYVHKYRSTPDKETTIRCRTPVNRSASDATYLILYAPLKTIERAGAQAARQTGQIHVHATARRCVRVRWMRQKGPKNLPASNQLCPSIRTVYLGHGLHDADSDAGGGGREDGLGKAGRGQREVCK